MLLPIPEIISAGDGSERAALIANNFEPAIAEQLIRIGSMDRLDDDSVIWDEGDNPHELSAGFVVCADSIDWVPGKISVLIDRHTASIEFLFDEGDGNLLSQFDKADFDVELGGMCFDSAVIEMLLPQSDVIQVALRTSATPLRPRGRPPKWDWEEAISHVVGLAQHPDGLPVGPGAQTLIEKAIAEWFVAEVGDAPAESQIRQRAQAIMRKIRRDDKQ